MTWQQYIEQKRGTEWLEWGETPTVGVPRDAAALHCPCSAVNAANDHHVAEGEDHDRELCRERRECAQRGMTMTAYAVDAEKIKICLSGDDTKK
jgi:hypothetical protein